MDDAGLMRSLEARADPPNDRANLGDAQHGSREGVPLDQLHRQEVGLFVPAQLEDPRDVFVGHPAGELHLSLEPLEDPRRARDVRVKPLEGDDLVEVEVLGTEDDPHSALPQLP